MSDEKRAELLLEYMDRLREKYPSAPSDKIRAKAEELVAKKLGKPSEIELPPVREAQAQAPPTAPSVPPVVASPTADASVTSSPPSVLRVRKKKSLWPWIALVGFVVWAGYALSAESRRRTEQAQKNAEAQLRFFQMSPIQRRIDALKSRRTTYMSDDERRWRRTAEALAARAEDALNARDYERASVHITAAEIYSTSGEYPPGYDLDLRD